MSNNLKKKTSALARQSTVAMGPRPSHLLGGIFSRNMDKEGGSTPSVEHEESSGETNRRAVSKKVYVDVNQPNAGSR